MIFFGFFRFPEVFRFIVDLLVICSFDDLVTKSNLGCGFVVRWEKKTLNKSFDLSWSDF